MSNLQTNYQALLSCDEEAETPQESDVIFHIVPESGKSRWNHIEDLDSFFRKFYHQMHGFQCIMLHEFSEVVQFAYAVLVIVYIFKCVDYQVLFKQKPPSQNGTSTDKVGLDDVLIPLGQCITCFGVLMTTFVILALIVMIIRLLRMIQNGFQYQEIKVFYETALKIPSADLNNVTWYEIQCRLREVQHEQQMCVHKQDLTELDIYHRILRHKNYEIAMLNKNLLPFKFKVPFLGDVVYLSKGLKYNIEFLFFWSPFSPFKSTWQLKDDYKKVSKRKELADKLSKFILLVGIMNFIISPFIFVWQVLYSFFSYSDILRREPGALGVRRWSPYARLYYRHFNELDHELKARLNRAYRPAQQYLNSFPSPSMDIIARLLSFIFGSFAAIMVILAIIDEDVLTVGHILLIMSASTGIAYVARTFMTDENMVSHPESLMRSIIAHIHYAPDHWKDKAHTTNVRDEFSAHFQYTSTYILEELLSPFITPWILCFRLHHRSLDIVDFFRSFTIDVAGVGDVCSFAMMDVSKHGNPQWFSDGQTNADQYQQAENGKTELSLIHFTMTNPNWIPPPSSSVFINHLKEQAQLDVSRLHAHQNENALYNSLHSLHSLGSAYADLARSILQPVIDRPLCSYSMLPSTTLPERPTDVGPIVTGRVCNTEGPLSSSQSGLLASLNPTQIQEGGSVMQLHEDIPYSLERTAANMSFSTLYLRELHFHQMHSLRKRSEQPPVMWQHPPPPPTPTIPDSDEITQDRNSQEGHGDEQLPLLSESRTHDKL